MKKNIWGNHKYLKGFKIKLENEIKMKLSRRIFLCLKKGKTKWKTATKTRCKKQTNFCMTYDRINKQKKLIGQIFPKIVAKTRPRWKRLHNKVFNQTGTLTFAFCQKLLFKNRLFQDYTTKTSIKHFCLWDCLFFH